MRIAIPVANGALCPHFGHCEGFMLVDADPEAQTITATQYLPAPEHVPGLLPRWLHDQGAQVVLAGGMGASARRLLEQQGVQVLTGVPVLDAETLVHQYLRGALVTGQNTCDH